ncbi:MAG: hypothetical protein ACQETD_09605, partial [Pseudomonadota bacterium]
GNWLHDMTESRPVTETLTDITTDGTRLVAVGDDETFIWSDDGDSWSEASVNHTDSTLRSRISWVEWTGSHYIAMSRDGIYNYLWKSDDGTQWNHTKIPHDILDLVWTGQEYLAVVRASDGLQQSGAILLSR